MCWGIIFPYSLLTASKQTLGSPAGAPCWSSQNLGFKASYVYVIACSFRMASEKVTAFPESGFLVGIFLKENIGGGGGGWLD